MVDIFLLKIYENVFILYRSNCLVYLFHFSSLILRFQNLCVYACEAYFLNSCPTFQLSLFVSYIEQYFWMLAFYKYLPALCFFITWKTMFWRHTKLCLWEKKDILVCFQSDYQYSVIIVYTLCYLLNFHEKNWCLLFLFINWNIFVVRIKTIDGLIYQLIKYILITAV